MREKIVRIFIGLIFLLIAINSQIEPWTYKIASLHNTASLDIHIVDNYFNSWQFGPFINRFFIALTGYLALSFLFLRKYKWELYLALGMSIFFLIDALIFWSEGIYSYWFTEIGWLNSIISDALLAAVLFLLIKDTYTKKRHIFWKVFPIIIIPVLFYIPFTFSEETQHPIIIEQHSVVEELKNESFTEDELIEFAKNNNIETNDKNLIFAFLSPNCSHCVNSAKKLRVVQDNGSVYRIVVFMNDFTEYAHDDFEEETRSKFETMFIDQEEFWKFANYKLPTIIVINKGRVKYYWQGNDLNFAALDVIK